jgi:hypothetical protein
VHRYRHDLESLFYVVIYVITRYHDGREIDDPPLQEWNGEGEVALEPVILKHSLMLCGLPNATQYFREIELDWAEAMRRAFMKGSNARSTYRAARRRAARLGEPLPEFDEETLGGHVSFKTFGDILSIPVE